MLSLLAAAFIAATPAQPARAISRPEARPATRGEAAPAAPAPPHELDMRPAAPEMELALLDPKVGPTLRIGALGGRHKAAPKLAHVALSWRMWR